MVKTTSNFGPRKPIRKVKRFHTAKAYTNLIDTTWSIKKIKTSFLDDILISIKRSGEEHKQFVLNCPKHLDEENHRIYLPKCHFSKFKVDWLGYHISQSGILPIESKISRSLESSKTSILSRLGTLH